MLKRIGILALFIMIALVGVVSVASAQGPNVDINQLLDRLKPDASSVVPAYLSYLLYAIFVLAFVTVFVVPDKQANLGYMMIFVSLSAVLVKVQFFYICGIVTLLLNIGMCVIPLIVGGMSRGLPGKTPTSLYLGILVGLLGGAYFFLFWAQVQSNTGVCQAVGNIDQMFGAFK